MNDTEFMGKLDYILGIAPGGNKEDLDTTFARIIDLGEEHEKSKNQSIQYGEKEGHAGQMETIDFRFKKIRIFTPLTQIASLLICFITTVYITYEEYLRDQKVFASYDPGFGTVFAPIYEEVIFRGIIQNELTRLYGTNRSIIGTSLLFGIYHLKNIYRLSPGIQVRQILRTGCVLGPTLSILAHKTKSIRPGSVLHYLNNIIATIHIPL